MQKILSIIALIITVIGVWLFWNGDSKVKQLLTSREWQSTTIAYMTFWDQKISTLDKAVITSTIKYLPNNTYLKISTLVFSSKNITAPIEINISESGGWELSDHYLVVTSDQFKDISTKPVTEISPAQVDELKKLFKISSQQSRRVDVVNEKTLLLTSLGHGSTILSSQ
ncbi:regulatory protein ToxS [Vibrio rumoiensis]|uniref:Transmembrane regulatory protein ToxS n=1 Tax=Vibrio rumoiensis 1S-45 TaxID=1188252 RepID=A0A1E5E0K4_9VIBR|nr:regulatory protein ToxS [Vibrio rumoiensis]OEF24003.1 hypothetical protein A1QC_02305 [Vibrio rumoiensis 1S-45]